MILLQIKFSLKSQYIKSSFQWESQICSTTSTFITALIPNQLIFMYFYINLCMETLHGTRSSFSVVKPPQQNQREL